MFSLTLTNILLTTNSINHGGASPGILNVIYRCTFHIVQLYMTTYRALQAYVNLREVVFFLRDVWVYISTCTIIRHHLEILS